jgi:hypothetical protein
MTADAITSIVHVKNSLIHRRLLLEPPFLISDESDYLFHNQNPRPNSEEIDKMACKTKLTAKQIKRWFKSEWDKRKKLTMGAIAKLFKIGFNNDYIHPRTKAEMFKVFVRPVMMYSMENFNLKSFLAEGILLKEEQEDNLLKLVQEYIANDFTLDQGYGDEVGRAEEAQPILKDKIIQLKGEDYWKKVEKAATLLTYEAEYVTAEEADELDQQIEEIASELGFTSDELKML